MRSNKVIVSIGCLYDGYLFIGPFKNEAAAEDWVEASQYNAECCEILPLEPPVDLSKG